MFEDIARGIVGLSSRAHPGAENAAMGRFLVMRMVGFVGNGLCGSQPADGKDADDE
jgi:hypothetical protein